MRQIKKIIFILPLFLICCDSINQNKMLRAEKKKMEWLTERAKKVLEASISENLLDETSYKPISYGPLVPVYKTKDDIQYEIDQIEKLIAFSDEIVKQNKSAGRRDDDYVINSKNLYVPYWYGLGYRFFDLGYFSSDEFINNSSFYDYEHRWTQRGNDRQSYSLDHDYSKTFAREYGDMFTGSRTRTVSSYDLQKKEVLIPRYEQLKEDLNSFTENELIGYDMVHKYNANNIYGGAETHTIEVHFDISCGGYWYIDKDKNSLIRIEHVYGIQ